MLFFCFFYACFYSSCPKPTTLHGNKCKLRTLLLFFFWLLNIVMVLYSQLSSTEVDLHNAVRSSFSDYQMQYKQFCHVSTVHYLEQLCFVTVNISGAVCLFFPLNSDKGEDISSQYQITACVLLILPLT